MQPYEWLILLAKGALALWFAVTTLRAITTGLHLSPLPATVTYFGHALLPLAAVLSLVAWRGRPRKRIQSLSEASNAARPALQDFDGRIFDLRDAAETTRLVNVSPSPAFEEIIRALASWNPRLGREGRNAHEHRFRDSLHRNLARKLDGGSSRIDPEFPLPAKSGHARKVDLAIDRHFIVEIKKTLRTARQVEDTLNQLLDYARRWEYGPTILALGDAGPTFRADLSSELQRHVARLRNEMPEHQWPVFAVAVGYRS